MWDINQPIKMLPREIRRYYAEDADYLYKDLKSNYLEVILIPAPMPNHPTHKVRAVQNRNPEWYRELYWSIKHFRRDLSLRALDRIRKEEDGTYKVSPFKYDSRYRELIHERLIEGYMENGCEMPPNNIVREFFGMKPNLEEILINP